MTLALFETGHGGAAVAEKELRNFTLSKPSYSRFIYLAWFYLTTEQPDKAADAVEQAMKYPIVDLPEDHLNTEARGYSIGLTLYRAGKYSTVIHLCDALLPVTENGNYAKPALRELRDAASHAAVGEKASFQPSESILAFSPYERLDPKLLLNR